MFQKFMTNMNYYEKMKIHHQIDQEEAQKQEVTKHSKSSTIKRLKRTKILTNDGTLNETADTIKVIAGGIGAIFNIDEVGSGGITDIVIDSKGENYKVGDKLVFNNTNST